MPFISKSRPTSELVPERERSRFKRFSVSLSHSIYRTSASSSQSNINEESLDDSMSVIDRPRPKKPSAAPLLPPKSELRASRILNNFTAELNALSQTNVAQISTESLSDPLEQYLSSEEDASESADDYYEDSVVEVDTVSISTQHTKRNSKEDTARVVSYTFVGKPSIIEISDVPASRQRQSSVEPQEMSKFRPQSMQAPRMSSFMRPESPARAMTSLTAPPRQSSRTRPLLTITNSMTSTSSKNSFLGTDPFANSIDSAIDLQSPMDISSPRTPSDKWKVGFRTVSRSFSFAKRPSTSRLSSSTPRTATAPSFPHTPITPRPVSAESQPETCTIQEEEIHELDSTIKTPSVSYQEIMRGVVKINAPPPSAADAKSVKHKSSMLGLGRRKSTKHR